uniref:Uncharacterized protein n=1 Tax=Ananas comosus var. bracteatus TaxID=296719 RepID=A0A6V7QV61_ANACO
MDGRLHPLARHLGPPPLTTPRRHAGILQVMIKTPHFEPIPGAPGDHPYIDFTGVDTRLPMFVYVSREKRPGYDHNKKAGAMNALVRAAILSNGPFILNFDCDHYIYNSLAIREGMCYMMDRGGDRICYIQFPQRFEGIDPSDRYANHNTVFFDGNMRALDGLQGPMYVGTGCLFRRYALYGFNPPRANEYLGLYGQHKRPAVAPGAVRGGDEEGEGGGQPLAEHPDLDGPNKFGNSKMFVESIAVAEYQGRPLADHPSVKNGRPPGRCWRRGRPSMPHRRGGRLRTRTTEWGDRVGWIYGSVTEDVVTGYRMHNRGWRSVYCITRRDAFRGTAPINLTDRLHQVLRWATGSVEIFFSKNKRLLASPRLKFLQRVAYLNVGIYPFTSIFLVAYCLLPALSLFSGHFIVQTLDVTFLVYLLLITITLMLLSSSRSSGPASPSRSGGATSSSGHRRHQRPPRRRPPGPPQGRRRHRDLLHPHLQVRLRGRGRHLRRPLRHQVDQPLHPPLAIIVINLVAIVLGFSRTVYSEIRSGASCSEGSSSAFGSWPICTLCQGPHGPERPHAHHRLCLGRAPRHHRLAAVDLR